MDIDSKSTDNILTNGVKEVHPVISDQSESVSGTIDMVDMTADAEFDQLCTNLNLPDDVKKKAWSQITKTELIVSAVYIAVVDIRMPYGPADPQLECGYLGQAVATVTDLLTYSRMRCTTLFQCLHVVGSVMSLSEAVKYHLKFLEKKYCIMSALYHTFERFPVTAVKINSIESINTEVQGLNSSMLQKLSEDLSCNYEELENLKATYEANYKHEGDLNEMAALNTIQQLKNMLASASDEPSLALKEFFNEKERLSQTDFSQLLNIDTFHVSLMACSMEIVLMTYDVSWNPSKGEMSSEDSRLSFPWILKHLQTLEIKILEELAWKSDSPLFDAMSNSEICQPNVSSPPDSNNGISASTAELYLSPMNSQMRSRVISPGTSTTLSSRKIAAGGSSPDKKHTTHKSQSLTIFLNKVCRLAYHSNTKSGPIMMCSLYSICKVMDKEIKFKAIVQMYRELPNAEQHVYKSALIQGAEHDSIIAFYNKVFMQNMKTYITMFAPTKQTPTLSPVPKPVSSPLTSPVYRIAHRNHLYVSPLKDSPFKAPHSPSQMTPTTRQLYCFGEGIGSAEKLRNINETVFRAKNGAKSVTPKSLKRLKFDQPDDSIQNSADVLPDNCTVIVKKRKMSPQSQQPPVLSIQSEKAPKRFVLNFFIFSDKQEK
ncbi:hypothetical protein KUTeg_012492 [Tegillarca granosa]|uniref:Uncharacterized protein n=1 Tax=Tegillarca granosa TaxID=220873 RepID=A0ABQ9EZN9_TEGGR|nr:hypothetical protein KUTeg_012492 [Tegillarca granosa]